MGVDHGGQFGVGGATANCPLRFCHISIQKGAFCGI